MNKYYIAFSILISFLVACSSGSENKKEQKADSLNHTGSAGNKKSANDLVAILSKRQVPILCYHHIREAKPGDSENMKSYSVSPSSFASQMKALSDSGFSSILPDQLYDYLVNNAELPSKPVMITFDDTDGEQYSIGATEMQKYGFKGVFFIMTVAINRPRYMTKEQIKNLSDSGHVIAAHTWDHHMVTKYQGTDWDIQFSNPKKLLETITGKPMKYFAYPFGLWNKAAIPELEDRGYQMAFILSTKRDSTEPLHTIRRMIVPGTWSTNGMLNAMRATFNK
jgi:hypothetical protein